MAEEQKPGAGHSRAILAISAIIALLAAGLAVFRSTPPLSPDATQPASNAPESMDATIAKLEAHLKDQPDDARGWNMLGWSFFSTRKFAEASTAYRRAAQLEPGKAEHWSALGEALVMAGPGNVSDDAKQAFARAVSLDPAEPRARYFLGVAQDMAGDHRGAIDAWLRLLADAPEGAPWAGDVRRLITEVGAREKIEVASRLAKIRPASPAKGAALATAAIPGPTAAEMRAAAQLPKGQQDAMIQGMVDRLEQRLAANPRNADGWIMLMRSRMTLGETVKARAAYLRGRTVFAEDKATLRQIDAAADALGIE